ncbi:MAG: class I SAM-dependent methyltransferase [Spirochaetales bacterium]|nr:class I SAM-dependent methyltransferase [Spirochaetales bacterium]
MKKVIAPSWDSYEIIDSGEGKKLERFGSIVLIRPDGGAKWKRTLSSQEWHDSSHGEFIEHKPGEGEWQFHREIPESWSLSYPLKNGNISFLLKLTRFKHVGVFPEQTVNWNYLYKNCTKESKVLNLFAHTGGASQAAALTGAEVTHVDSVYSMVGWARTNGEAGGVQNIRWICEDSMTFLERELKRGRSYDKIIMDPPTYGFSKKGKQWKIERDLEPLLERSAQLLSEEGEIILNCYSQRMEKQRLIPLLNKLFTKENYTIEELYLQDRQEKELFCGYLVRIILS